MRVPSCRICGVEGIGMVRTSRGYAHVECAMAKHRDTFLAGLSAIQLEHCLAEYRQFEQDLRREKNRRIKAEASDSAWP